MTFFSKLRKIYLLRLLTTIFLPSFLGNAENVRPKLVVGIVVDQLRSDYIEFLSPLFSRNGFRKFTDEGHYFSDVDFNADVSDPAAATTLVFTGNYAPASGVASAMKFDPSSRRMIPTLSDPTSLGHFTNEALSPANIRLSTIADEIAIDGAGLSAIYAISADPQQSIAMAGHSANSALWISDNDGAWASSAYYRDFPSFISQRNRLKPLSARLDTMQWKPLLPLSAYPGLPAQKRQYPFRYTFPRSQRDVYKNFKNSPLANTEITNVAIDLLKNQNLGRRGDAIDFLAIGYSTAPYRLVRDGDYRLELQDTYIMLDRQIERLLNYINSTVGLANTLIFMTSTGYYDDAVSDDPKYRIPGGDFSLKRAISLLNSYLSAKFGNGEYAASIRNGRLYLTHEATTKALSTDPDAIRNEARDFLLKMSGIDYVKTLPEVLSLQTPEGEKIRNSIDPKQAPDLFITFSPGWNVIDDTAIPSTTTPIRLNYYESPLFILAPGIKPLRTDEPVKATSIAPTIARLLHIRTPNGAAASPINMNSNPK